MKKTITGVLVLALTAGFSAGDVFQLKPELAGRHPRILFTQEEANALKVQAQASLSTDYNTMISDVNSTGYPTDPTAGEWGQSIWWRLCRVAIAAALSQDQGIIDLCKDWLGRLDNDFDFNQVELNPAHVVGAYALAYDCVYNSLSAAEKTACQTNLRTAVNAYVAAHAQPDYWNFDYANNHMHFRCTALLYSVLALYGETSPSIQPQADSAYTYFRRIAYSLGPDGSSHEGLNYMKYGHNLLIPGFVALKHCTPRDITQEEHYRNLGYYYLYHVTPGWGDVFAFGDCAGGHGGFSEWLFRIAKDTRDPYIQATALSLYNQDRSDFWQTHWSLIHRDPGLAGGTIADLPRHRFFDDIGILVCRSDWTSTATAVAFKCGPLGGARLMSIMGGTSEYHPHLYDVYNSNSLWVAVAHDDPDAGTFLLFSRGRHLTVGDGYEKDAKITTQHSTFIVDDATQYGCGGGWCQPPGLDKLAWTKDYFDAGERVVFSGDMKAVYPNMTRLDRTFVSHQAQYIVIHDDAVSATAGRTFEWRLQTTGTLASQGNKTYQITSGAASALARIYAPAQADWSTTTNKIGNILRARLSSQQQNRFLVLIWPNAANLTAVSNFYDETNLLGLKIVNNNRNEYTLFAKDASGPSSVGTINMTASTALVVENGTALEKALVINGTSFTYNSVAYFSGDNRASFSIDTLLANQDGGVYKVGPASGSNLANPVNVTIGGLKASTGYPVNINYESTQNVTTDASGAFTLPLALNRTNRLGVGTLAAIRDMIKPPSASWQPLHISPHPLCGQMLVTFQLPGEQVLDITILDQQGNVIKRLHQGRLGPGRHTFTWDLADQDGNQVLPGLYLIKTGNTVSKMVVVK